MVNRLSSFTIYFMILLGNFCSHAINYETLGLRDGAKLRLAYSPSKGQSKGIVLFLQGMGSFIERHVPTIEEINNNNYDVWTFDWRSQGASSRMSQIPTLCHIDRFSTYIEDLREVITKISPNKPVTILANSMGGHIALRYAHDYPGHITSMVLLAPMLDIKTRKFPKVIAQTIARTYVNLTGGERFVFGDGPFEPTKCLERYRSDIHGERAEYDKTCHLLASNPSIATGGVSFGWLHAAFRSIKLIQQDKYLETITVPTLMMTPEQDHVVENKIQGKACAKMQNCRQIMYPNGRHNLFAETPEILGKVMADFYAFIEPKDELVLQLVNHVD